MTREKGWVRGAEPGGDGFPQTSGLLLARALAWRAACTGVAAAGLLLPAAVSGEPSPVLDFAGMCEASAAAQVAPGTFVVANDEDNVLRMFAFTGGEPRVDDKVLSFLGLPTTSGSDIEGAARLGDRIYWITSHSLTKKGKEKPERFALFATDIVPASPAPVLRAVPAPSRRLRALLTQSKLFEPWNLRDAAGRTPEKGLNPEDAGRPKPRPADAAEAARRAEGGLNIEGLATRRDGRLLVGLRSPIRHGRALVFTLSNPAEALEGKEPLAEQPMEIDLGGLGVRSLERIGDTDDYLIAAGPVNGGAPFRLFRWHLGEPSASLLRSPPPTLAAEAVVLPAERPGQVLLLSDDGDFPKDGACGLPTGHFRGVLQSIEEPLADAAGAGARGRR